MDQILLFGDSLTQQSSSQETGFAFHPALQDTYIRRLDVVNRGFSGYNTAQALKVLPHIIAAPTTTPTGGRIRLVTIFFGANDARLPNTPGPSQFVPLEAYRANLRTIATYAPLRAHQPRIVLITPPPIDERLCEITDAAKGIHVTRRTAANTAAYAQAVRDLGRELGVPVLDLWTAFMREAGWNGSFDVPLVGAKEAPQSEVLVGLLHDGLHFTPAGYRIMYREFMAMVQREVPDLVPDRLPFVLPTWDDVRAWEQWTD